MANLDSSATEPEQPAPHMNRDTPTNLGYTSLVVAKKSKRGGYRPGSGRKPILTDPMSVKGSLDGETYDRLAEAAEERETSMGVLVREAVERYLGKSRTKRRK